MMVAKPKLPIFILAIFMLAIWCYLHGDVSFVMAAEAEQYGHSGLLGYATSKQKAAEMSSSVNKIPITSSTAGSYHLLQPHGLNRRLLQPCCSVINCQCCDGTECSVCCFSEVPAADDHKANY